MGMDGILCALSRTRLALLEDDPSILADLLDARFDTGVPGLLDLGKYWHALDLILDGPKDPVLGDAILARTGTSLKAKAAYGAAHVLPAARVIEVATVLGKLPSSLILDRYPTLRGKEVHGGFGQETAADDDTAYIKANVARIRAEEIETLGEAMSSVIKLYTSAAKDGHSMMSVVV